jgi:hypothetical protein
MHVLAEDRRGKTRESLAAIGQAQGLERKRLGHSEVRPSIVEFRGGGIAESSTLEVSGRAVSNIVPVLFSARGAGYSRCLSAK